MAHGGYVFVETNGAHQFFNCTILAENAETRGKGLAGRHQRRAKHHQSVFNHLNFTTDLGSQSPLITTSSTFHLILAFSFLFRSSRFVLFIVFFLFPFFFSFFLFFLCVSLSSWGSICNDSFTEFKYGRCSPSAGDFVFYSFDNERVKDRNRIGQGWRWHQSWIKSQEWVGPINQSAGFDSERVWLSRFI